MYIFQFSEAVSKYFEENKVSFSLRGGKKIADLARKNPQFEVTQESFGVYEIYAPEFGIGFRLNRNSVLILSSMPSVRRVGADREVGELEFYSVMVLTGYEVSRGDESKFSREVVVNLLRPESVGPERVDTGRQVAIGYCQGIRNPWFDTCAMQVEYYSTVRFADEVNPKWVDDNGQPYSYCIAVGPGAQDTRVKFPARGSN